MNLSKKFSSQRSRQAQKNLITILGNIRICIRYLKKALMKQKVFLFIKEKTHFYRKNLLLFISCIKNFGFSKFLFTRRYPVRDEGRREKQNVKNNIILRIFQNLIFKKTQNFFWVVDFLSRFLLFSWPQFCWSKKYVIDQTGYCSNSGSCNAIQLLAQGGISVSGDF